MNSCIAVNPGDPAHEKLSEVISSSSRPRVIDYEQFSVEYNEAETGAIILVPAPAGYRSSNFVTVILNRGLRRDDFSVSKLSRDSSGKLIDPAERPLAVIKKSSNKITINA